MIRKFVARFVASIAYLSATVALIPNLNHQQQRFWPAPRFARA
jgi:hypothetical protein